MTDSIEVTLPVDAPTVTRVESVAGSLPGTVLDIQAIMPEAWKQGRGTMDVTVSTCPWLPEITGLPALLEYPHGCFEQISSRLLGYAMLGNLLAFLPDSGVAGSRVSLHRGARDATTGPIDLGKWNAPLLAGRY